MRDLTRSELEAIVADAEANPTLSRSAASKTRADDPRRQRRDRLSATVSEEIKRLPLDHGRLESLAREDRGVLRRRAEEARRSAVDAAGEAAKRLDALVTSPHGPLGVNPVDWEPGSFVLETVDFIRSWPTPENLRDSHVGQASNWAEYAVNQSGDSLDRHFSERVSFYTFWRNPRQNAVVATALARLKVNGHCGCSAEGEGVASWFFDNSLAHVDVSARLTLWGLWTDPALRVPVGNVPLGSVTARGGFFGDDAETSITAAPLVVGAGFPIPARAYILIEASVIADYELLDGSVDLDFTSGAFRIECPGMGVILAPSTMTLQT